MRSVVLIVGNRDDPHVEVVRDEILRRGGACFIFDRYSNSDTLTCCFNETGARLILRCAEGEIIGSDVDAVWWRLKQYKPWSPPHSELEIASEFAAKEWRSVLYGLPSLLSHAKWLNRFPAHWQAGYKPTQLKLAQEVGFLLPATTVSNHPDDIKAQVQNVPRCVYKQLSNFMFPSTDFIFTNEISASAVDGQDESIRLAPGIYQELLEKEAEWRVTVVGEAIFPIRIDSQNSELTALDWRRDQLNDMYSIAELPVELSARILEFNRRMGLDYAAFDFIERKSGAMVFLECNPAGQWLWLEDATDAPISAAIASFLLSGQPSERTTAGAVTGSAV